MHSSIQSFLEENGYQYISELHPDHALVVEGGPFKRRVLLKVDWLDAAHRPGKPKGIAKGDALQESKRMEQVFAVMKDFRFFKLCLPGMYGMGRYQDQFDWVIFKWYDGERFAWSEHDDEPAVLGGKAIPPSMARDAAMMVFDLTQVPVLKFSKKVPTRNYPEETKALQGNAAAAVSLGFVTQVEVDALCTALLAFFEKKVPTLYTIQNGNFYPRNFLQLAESIVLLDWDSAVISTVEEVIAYEWILMWGNPEWQKTFLNELEYLMDVNQEWLAQMIKYRALHQLVFWAGITRENEKKVQSAIKAMQQYI